MSAGQPIARIRNEALLVRLSDAQGALRLAERQGLTAQAVGNTSEAATRAHARRAAAQSRSRCSNGRSLHSRCGLPPRASSSRRDWMSGSAVTVQPVSRSPGSAKQIAPKSDCRCRKKTSPTSSPNDRVRVRVAARPEIRFDGRVSSVAPLAEILDGEPHYTVRAILDNQSQILRPGMQARARVLTASRPLGYLLIRRPWRWARLHLWW